MIPQNRLKVRHSLPAYRLFDKEIRRAICPRDAPAGRIVIYAQRNDVGAAQQIQINHTLDETSAFMRHLIGLESTSQSADRGA